MIRDKLGDAETAKGVVNAGSLETTTPVAGTRRANSCVTSIEQSMAKRLHMTTADYVTIAVSPALIMTLVGSLVYFLIEVMYAGDYAARLMYVFALFVFAAVLIARISIEEGSEYASLFALPLGLATFFVLLKFVEHPSPFSWLINIVLMCTVWWCAHKLTWDCTLIDDEEDSSGEGLMQRIGVDELRG